MKIDPQILKDLSEISFVLQSASSPVWVKTSADILRRIADDLDRAVDNARPDTRQP